MRTLLNSAADPAHDSLIEKKSEFIGDACHIESGQEALDFVQSIRDLHPKARHVAYAAVWGGADGQLGERMSDDGEPSGTAGKPILDVLRQSELTDCVVTVTRYFGGILLGSGGLIRAYSSAASLAVKAAKGALIVPCRCMTSTFDYAQLAMMRQLISAANGTVDDEQFTDRITAGFSIPEIQADDFERRVVETFNATVSVETVGSMNRPVPD
ncbi:IMPACT family member YigZ [Bifidobacterium margollesii]|uniref:IMPACT family member YigZ n=1 Tax=Bifidobacterium margollesii TaxID=2020964 RepID=A0A2N5JBZ2_9BIFI|nr:YigZ family protein [Bifidobacterium margollesii]PLS31725.1 IMPACT family member YigZ [Bifidobacterium margollesii]